MEVESVQQQGSYNPKKLMYRAKYLMSNWDDPDVQWAISLGNTEQIDKFMDQKLEQDNKARTAAKL
jgi:hypothetical protein